MAIVLTDFVKETLSLHCFGTLSAFDGNKRNEMSRVFGYSYSESTGILSILISKASSAKLVACLSKSGKLAFVASDPMTFKTIQMKGAYLSHADASPEEVNLINNEFGNKRKAVVTMFGMPENIVENWKTLPAISIKMEVKEIFDQTPRINTGNKIS